MQHITFPLGKTASRMKGLVISMFGIKRRRTLIRVLSYTISAFCIAIIFAVSGFVMAYKFRMNTEYSYQRALGELSEHVDNIDIALQKGYYASTSAQLVGLTSQIWSDAGAANTDLAQMPLTSVNLGNTTKFLSQVGDYANSLGKRLAQNQVITDNDRNTIKTLSDYAKKLSTQLSGIQNDLQKGRLTLFKSEGVLNASNIKAASAQPTVADGFAAIENSFSGLPSFIYDGPFSDNILKRTPSLTKGQANISADTAKANAAKFLGIDAAKLSQTGETAGSLPTYNFSSGTISIYVAKAGGYVVRMLDNRTVTSEKISTTAAAQKAAAFLQSRGISSMKPTYYLTNNNISTVNFAFDKDNVICYPDLIKLGVALDNGGITSFDATGYIMNHTNRTLPAAQISQAAIRAKINPHLHVNEISTALIPTDGGGEALCYEFKCTGTAGQSVIDYFNTQTGVEQQLLILISTPGGTLAL